MHTEVHNAVTAADQGTQYDESAKRLLGQKSILAQILVRTVDEFKGMNPRYVETLIEGEPYISRISLEPGLTNQEVMKAAVELKAAGEAKQNLGRKVKAKSGQRITGLNTENQEHAEGLVRFDIVFYVRMKDGLSQIIINVEAQKDEPQRYGILNRAVFYVSRLISSQKERDFVKSNYNDIKTVYSIWVCMNMPENSMCHIYLTKEDLLGKHNWKGNLNLVNIVMIGLTNALPESHNEYVLHRLLCAMFSNELSQQQKMKIMEQEYHIPMEENFKEEVSIMCNLSQGIKEAGIAEGREAGIVEGREAGIAEGKQREIEKVILNMHKKGYSLEQIMDATELEAAELETIIEKLK